MYGWTWWLDDDDVGRIKHDTTASTNHVDDFAVPSSIGMVGGILKEVLKNVLLNDSSTPYITPMIPKNENIRQNQEKNIHHRFSIALVKQWIQQILNRFEEHKNRHKVI